MSRQVHCFINLLVYTYHRQFRTVMLPVFVLALPLLVLAVSLSCSRPATVVSEMVTQTQQLKDASPTMVPTRLYFSRNSPPPAHSECTLMGM